MSSELGRRPEGFVMSVVSGNSYQGVVVGEGARAHLGNVNADGGTINYNNYSGPLSSYLWSLAMTVVGAATTFIIRQATESSVPAELRQATSDNRPAQVASKPISQREIYIKAAGSLNTVKTRVELWDTNGLWSTRPELKRDGFLMAVLAEYVTHFRDAGMKRIPHILMVNDNIQIEDCQLVDAVGSFGDVVEGPRATIFAHHKMAAWKASANHFGFDIYIFRCGTLKHVGLNGNGGDHGGKGYGNWMWYNPPDRKAHEPARFSRQDLGPQRRDPNHEKELVTFFAPFGEAD